MPHAPKRRARLDSPEIFPLVSEEHAAAIGYVAIRWAEVEAAMNHLVAILLQIDGPAAHALTADRPGVAVSNLVNVLMHLSGDIDAINEWKNLSSRYEKLRPLRNDAIHAEWQVSGNNHMALRRKPKAGTLFSFKAIETSSLNHLSDAALEFAEELVSFVSRTILPRGIPKKVVSLYPPGLYEMQPLLAHPTKPTPPPNRRSPKLSSAQKRGEKAG